MSACRRTTRACATCAAPSTAWRRSARKASSPAGPPAGRRCRPPASRVLQRFVDQRLLVSDTDATANADPRASPTRRCSASGTPCAAGCARTARRSPCGPRSRRRRPSGMPRSEPRAVVSRVAGGANPRRRARDREERRLPRRRRGPEHRRVPFSVRPTRTRSSKLACLRRGGGRSERAAAATATPGACR